MNEAQWLAERANSQQMLGTMHRDLKVWRTKAGKRKLRLFACGCCRLIWDHLPDPRLQAAVEVAEKNADGLASKEELALTRERTAGLVSDSHERGNWHAQERTAASLAWNTTSPQAFDAAGGMTCYALPLGGYRGDPPVAEALLCDLLRCVFGNPFRPAPMIPAWRRANDGAAVRIAQDIYEERAFDRLPLLADALEDAGCDAPTVLGHCRGGGPHARGCWVVDGLLAGK